MGLLVSICITSYNRPIQLKRCLTSIATTYSNEIEVIIGDDSSPSLQYIQRVVNDYRDVSSSSIVLLVNEWNLGYDHNFYKLIKAAKGKYILFITDDDAFLPASIDKLIVSLRKTDYSAIYTPYLNVDSGLLCRSCNNDYAISAGISSVRRHLYHSILLSGLIFKRDAIPSYDPSQLRGLIYSQVFVFICIIYQHGGGYLNIPLVAYVGDGVNGFGTNPGEAKNSLLANREHHLSNLEYNKRLANVITIFDSRYSTSLLKSISKSYSLRCFSGLCYARSFGITALREYAHKLSEVGFDLGYLPSFYILIIRIFGLNNSLLLLHAGKYVYSLRARLRSIRLI